MKSVSCLVGIILTLILGSCTAKKDLANSPLYTNTWELEYMSGPKIALDGLFPDKKPQLTFDKAAGEVRGNSGCNGYSAKFKGQGKDISFGEPGPATMMYCGEGEHQFLNMLNKINRYSIDKEGKLNLMINEVPIMRFKPIEHH